MALKKQNFFQELFTKLSSFYGPQKTSAAGSPLEFIVGSIPTQKARQSFLNFLQARFAGSIARMREEPAASLRIGLIAIQGIGKETADGILLALEHPIFVVDTHTYRVFTRHYLAPEETGYDELQEIAMDHLPGEAANFQEYHALLVAVGKEFCRSTALCESCPLKGLNW